MAIREQTKKKDMMYTKMKTDRLATMQKGDPVFSDVLEKILKDFVRVRGAPLVNCRIDIESGSYELLGEDSYATRSSGATILVTKYASRWVVDPVVTFPVSDPLETLVLCYVSSRLRRHTYSTFEYKEAEDVQAGQQRPRTTERG